MKTLDALIAVLKEAKEELTKAIKPGPSLDYAKINPAPNRTENAAPVINYQSNSTKSPIRTPSAAETAVAEGVKAKRAEGRKAKEAMVAPDKETALHTIQARVNQTKKSDDEPHKDDPKHEDKEKKKAKKIKKEAESLLDMHKMDGAPPPPPPPNAAAQSIMGAFKSEEDEGSGEMIKASGNGQWSIDKIEMAKPKKKK